MRKLLTVFCAIFIASLGVAQNPSVFPNNVFAVSHDTANVSADVYYAGAMPTDTNFAVAMVSTGGAYSVASDTLLLIGPGPHSVVLTMRNLTDTTAYSAQVRAFTVDTVGVITWDQNPQNLPFTTLLGPIIGEAIDIDAVQSGLTALMSRLYFKCGNIETQYTIEWGPAFGVYTWGSLTLTLKGSGDTTFVATNLQSCSTVYFRVKTFNTLGFGTPLYEDLSTQCVQGLDVWSIASPSWYAPDSAAIQVYYDLGTYNGGFLSGILKDTSWTTINTMPATSVSGSGMKLFNASNLQPMRQHYWIAILSDSSGTVTVRDTISFTAEDVDAATGTLTIAGAPDRSSVSYAGTFNTNGLFNASKTIYFVEVFDLTDNVLLGVDSLGEKLGSGAFSGTKCDLLGGHTIRLRLYGIRNGWSTLLDSKTTTTQMPQTPYLKTYLDTLPGRYVRAMFIYDGRGNYATFEAKAYVNRDPTLMSWDTTLLSCPDTLVWVSGPYQPGDSVFIDAAVAYGSNGNQEPDGKWFIFPELPDTTTPPPTGINETTNEVAIFVTSDVVNVAGPLSNPMTFQVFSLAGQLVYIQDLVSGYNHYRIDNVMGVYLYQISDEAGEIIKTGKILY